MKNFSEKPVTPEEAAELFKKMREEVNKEPETEEGPNTGSGAMDAWQRAKETKEDESQDKRRAA